MESRKFDELSKALAAAATRRGIVRGTIGGALGMLGLSGAAAKPRTVDICHATGNGSYRHISVSENALPAHEAHGDLTWCSGSGYLDFTSCTCQCPLTVGDCPGGVDTEACRCIPVACEAKQADCGDPSLTCSCGELLGSDEFVCIDRSGPNGYTCSPGSGNVCPGGMVCADDDGCGDYYCYPRCGEAAAFAMMPDLLV